MHQGCEKYQLRLRAEPATIGGEYSLALADHRTVFEVIWLEVKHPLCLPEGCLVRQPSCCRHNVLAQLPSVSAIVQELAGLQRLMLVHVNIAQYLLCSV
jgi:hypothetical protein